MKLITDDVLERRFGNEKLVLLAEKGEPSLGGIDVGGAKDSDG